MLRPVSGAQGRQGGAYLLDLSAQMATPSDRLLKETWARQGVWCKTFLGVKCVPSLTNARFSWTTVKAVEKVTAAEVGTGWAVTSCPTSGYLSQRLSAAASLKRPKCRVSEWMNKWGIKLGLDRPSRAGTVTFHM